MAGWKKNLTNPFLYRQFSNSVSDMYHYTTSNLMDGFYNNAMSSTTEGTFKAVCLSGIRTGENEGDGPDINDASIVGALIEIIVRPLTPFGDILPDPRLFTDPIEINDAISIHKTMWTARSDFGFKDQSSISFGQVVNCYFEDGSIANSNFSGLRFSEPQGLIFVKSFEDLSRREGVITGATAFGLGLASLLGFSDGSPASTSPAQLAFIDKLGKALRGKGLQFHVTDRSRTVDDQMNRIMNKYNNNSPAEVVSTYGKTRGAAMVKAIQSGDTATFRKLASESSKHLEGAAIDIRSKWYTDDEISIVLGIIRELGGNPLLENIKGCWTSSGRNVTTTKRVDGAKAGGRGRKTPCHNEHIHIDIPKDFR